MGKNEASSDSGENVLKKVWNAGEEDGGAGEPSNFSLGAKLAFMGVVLILAVALMAWSAIRRSEMDMTRLLEEKGASLLMAFDSALRTGMRGQAGLAVQTLFEEMSKSPDILFISVTMPDGIILAHSDRSRIGEEMILDDNTVGEEVIDKLKPQDDEKSVLAQAKDGEAFLVYRNFTLGNRNWPDDVPEPVIFLALDAAPFKITRAQNRNYITMIGVVTLLCAFIGLLVFSFAQKAAESRKSQKLAEGEARRLAKEVARNEKLAAVGTLAAGVAHEIRNPLSSIKGYATYFQYRFEEGSEDREAAAVMAREVDRLNRVITDLLGLSNQARMKIADVNMGEVLDHVARLLRENAASHRICLRVRKAAKVPQIKGDMEKLSQAILNLCLNAMDAMPDGGELTLAVSGGGKYICISVRDNGEGIPEDIRGQIFDPYFTTKGSGTGLGLPMVHKIITAHGGQVEVYSRIKGEGGSGMTIFNLWIPVNGAEEEGRPKKGRNRQRSR